MDHVDATVDTAGGAWTFDDRTTPWSSGVASTYKPEACIEGDGSKRFSLSLFGPGTTDPQKALAGMREAWKALGYTVRAIVPAGDDHPEIGADTTDGTRLGYTVGSTRSAVTAQS